MSLLMEALRKAEKAKRQAQNPTAEAAPQREPVPFRQSVAPDPEQDELHHYRRGGEALPVDDAATPQRPRVGAEGVARPSKGQLAAASLFAAKQRASVPGSRLLKPLLLGLAVLLPLLGVGLWYLQQDHSIILTPPLAQVDATAAAPLANETMVEPLPADSEATPPSLAMPAEPAPAASEHLADAPGAAFQTEPDDASATMNPPANPEALAAAEPQTLPESTTQEPAAALTNTSTTEPSRLQVSRSREESTVNSNLQAAWEALQNGELEAATGLYRNTLAELPNNRDALLGLAVIHNRNNELDQARRLYAQALTLNPQDPLARTGLLQAMGTDNTEVERELRKLLDSYPELAPLHFALGNFYAARQRWSDAQSAYFNALLYADRSGNGPVSPDYAFNLAVSLEQLQQPRAALDYYRRADLLSRQSVPGFDSALLHSRLRYLEQNLP